MITTEVQDSLKYEQNIVERIDFEYLSYLPYDLNKMWKNGRLDKTASYTILPQLI